jgi:hypothetical protein
MFNFIEEATQEANQPVIGWFINTSFEGYVPRFAVSLKSAITEGAWDTFLNRVVEKSRWDLIDLTVESVNLNREFTEESVVDAELDALMSKEESAAPLLTAKKKQDVVPAFCWINVSISTSYIDGEPLRASVVVPQNAPRIILSKMLAASKMVNPDTKTEILSVVDPRVEKVFTLKPMDF